MKKDRKAVKVGSGIICPRCHQKTARFEHGPAWSPKRSQAYYFRFWDYCRCGYVQHYEHAKVYAVSTACTDLAAQKKPNLGALVKQNPEQPDWETYAPGPDDEAPF